MTKQAFDVIVVGAGPAGCTASSLLAKAGYRVGVFEKEAFPRFHIGESLLPHSKDILNEVGFWEKLDGRYMRKYGAQFIDHSGEHEIYFEFADGLDNKHPMAYEVQREFFDRDYLEHAKSLGVEVYQPETIEDFEDRGEYVVVRTKSQKSYQCRYVVDATGRDALTGVKLRSKRTNSDLNHVAAFAHYENVARLEGNKAGDIIIGILPEHSWSWFIPFIGKTTSVGVVTSAEIYKEHRKDPLKFLASSIAASGTLSNRMRGSRRISEVQTVANYSFKCDDMAGDRWIMVGDAGAFLDPVFSSGVHIAITSAKFAVEHLIRALESDLLLSIPNIKETYESDVRRGMQRFKFIIDIFYSLNFAKDMQRVMGRKQSKKAFTSALAGDMWNDDNPIFKIYDIKKGFQKPPQAESHL